MGSEKAFKFTIGLLYPAFLGSVIFNIFNDFSVQRITANPVMYILTFLIITQYVMDYLYTNTDKIRKEYSCLQAGCDFFIVVFLFMSINAASEVPNFKHFTPYIAVFLAGTKLLALAWELFRHKKEGLAIGVFGFFLFVYCLVQYCAADKWYAPILILVLIVDILVYYEYEPIKLLVQGLFRRIRG